MTDVLWVGIAIAVGVLGFLARRGVRRRIGRHALGRLAGEFFGWYAYIAAIAIVAVQTNGGWHPGRRTTVELRSTWSEEGPIYLLLATLLAVGFFLYGERRSVDWLGDIPFHPFSPDYVAEILDGEADSTQEQCRRMARRLKRIARKSRRPLPPPLAVFVERHLDLSDREHG